MASRGKGRKTTWTVRPYLLEDFGPVTQLGEEIHALDVGAPIIDPARWRYVCSDPHADPESHFRVAEQEGGGILGFSYRFDPPRPGGGTYRAIFVVVHPRWRRKGIGTELYDATRGEAPDGDEGWFMSSVVDERCEGGWPFARKLGFKRRRTTLTMTRVIPGQRLPEDDSDARIERFLGATAWQDWADLHNQAFEGREDYRAMTADELEERRPEGFRPEHVRFAKIDGERVGYIFLRETSRGGFIEEIGVRPDQSGEGVGTALLISAIEYLEERGHTRVDLSVGEENSGALQMYARLGFEEEAKRLHLRRDAHKRRR